MNEKMFFFPKSKPEIFIHAHYPLIKTDSYRHVIIFLNPIFDEKKRVQQFQAQMARAITEINIPVYRFDYYGTGDSKGNSYDFNIERINNDLTDIYDYIRNRYPEAGISLLGVRLGADIGIAFAEKFIIENLLLIEPVFNIATYITEQRMRRKIFLRLNNMNTYSEKVKIGNEEYEDFQGYLLAKSAISVLENINSLNSNIKNKTIYLYKLDHLFSKKQYQQFIVHAQKANKIIIEDVSVTDFWSKLENIDTTELITKIKRTVSVLK